MKKNIFFLTIMLISSLLMAQTTFTIGPKAGINFAKVTSDDASFSSESVLGYQGGGFIRVSIDRLYLQPELLFIHKGSELINPADPKYLNSQESIYTITMSSLEIPLLIGFKIIDSDEFNVRAMAGPVIDLALQNDLVLKLDGEDPPSNIQQFYSKDDLKNGIFSFNLGAGVDIGAFTFDIRYDFGVSDISDILLFKKLNTFSISVGVKIF